MDTVLRKHKWFVLLIVVALLVLAGANLGSAQTDEPIELQPSYILMNGEDEVGLVYALDYGWILADDGGMIYTCGCNGCEVEEIGYFAPDETPEPGPNPTDLPPTDPPPTDPPPTDPPPTDPPPTEKPKKPGCNNGGGNGSEGCSPSDKGNDDE